MSKNEERNISKNIIIHGHTTHLLSSKSNITVQNLSKFIFFANRIRNEVFSTTLIIVVFVLFCIHLFRKFMILFCYCIAINMTIFYAINVELN